MRRWPLALGLAIAALASIPAATAIGTEAIPLGDAFAILIDALRGSVGGSAGGGYPAWERTVLLAVRLPRVLVAAAGGAGLAVAGGAMQGLFRNPLADPGVLGVSSGAALGAVFALYLGASAGALVVVPSAAFAGALACALIVYALATRRGRSPATALLLSGIAVGGVATALVSFLLSVSLARWELAQQMLSWLMGGLEGRSFVHLAVCAPPVAIGTAALFVYARDLDALATGEEDAAALGVDVPHLKRAVLVLASLTTAATVAVMGSITFVGLMVPHAVRMVAGPGHRRLLASSFFAGALFLVWVDVLCRAVADAVDLRPGVISALLGGPFFLLLLWQRLRRGGMA